MLFGAGFETDWWREILDNPLAIPPAATPLPGAWRAPPRGAYEPVLTNRLRLIADPMGTESCEARWLRYTP